MNDVRDKKNEDSAEEKLDKIVRGLPPDVQAEILQIIRREPRIASLLVNSEGRDKEIVHAVRAGREAGRAVSPPPPKKQRSLLSMTAKFMRGILTLQFTKSNRERPYVDPANFPGVHPDFAGLARGAYYNAMPWGIEEHYGEHHDHEHDHDHEHYHAHEHLPAREEPQEAQVAYPHYHTHHAQDVLRHEKEHTEAATTHSGH